jgi:hypothetical protein
VRVRGMERARGWVRRMVASLGGMMRCLEFVDDLRPGGAFL